MSTDEVTMIKALALAAEAVRALPRWCDKSGDLWPMMRLLENKIGRSNAALYRAVAHAKLDKQGPIDWPSELMDEAVTAAPSEQVF